MARRTVKEVSTDLDKVSDRLHDLEGSHTDLQMQHKLLHKDVAENTQDISDIKDYFKWFMKVVIGLFASAVVGFIVQGGLV
jgi:chromosome segregation ATPase